MHLATLEVELHIPLSRSLKDKRAAIKPILEGSRRRFHVAAAEVAFQDKWQRAGLGFAAVGDHAGAVMEKVERFVWSFPEVEVLTSTWGDDA